MGINGVNDYSSMIQNYKVPSIPSVSVEEVQKQEAQQQEAVELQASALVDTHEESPVASTPRQDTPLEDISITFNKQEDFSYLGKDSDIHSLDMEQAISDMQKDQVLHQYQYFVGNSRNLFGDNSDGVVIPKF